MRPYVPILLSVLLLGACSAPPEITPSDQWYKGNLHTHTLWSDGDDFPELIVDWYRNAGYDFLALSDHNTLSVGERWVVVDEALQPAFDQYLKRFSGKIDTVLQDDTTRVRLATFEELRTGFEEVNEFILLQAEEITESVDKLPVHLNATNLVEFIPPQGGSTVREVLQRNIDAVLEQRDRTGQPMIPHVNHPNFGWGVSVDDLLAIDGEQFFEVYNGHPLVRNLGDSDHPSMERIWDVILTHRATTGSPPLFGLAVDDAHHYHGVDGSLANPGRGWIMVRADSLAPNSIVEALEDGNFYATTGVELLEFEATETTIAIKIDAQPGIDYRIEFVGSTRASGEQESAIGVVLATVDGHEASYELQPEDLYARARVVSTKPMQNPNRPGETEVAWTQPIGF